MLSLDLAVKNRDIESIIYILRKPDGDLENINKLDYALINASYKGMSKIVNILLKEGANIDSTYYTRTPLMYACIGNSPDSVNLLLDRGANVNLQDNVKNTALHYATRSAIGSKNIVKSLLKFNASVDIQNNLGNTPLMQTAEWLDIQKANLLFEAAGSTRIQNNEGKTGLMIAVNYSNNYDSEYLKILLEYDLYQISITDNNGKKADHYSRIDYVKNILLRKEKEYENYINYSKERVYYYLKNVLYDDLAKIIIKKLL